MGARRARGVLWRAHKGQAGGWASRGERSGAHGLQLFDQFASACAQDVWMLFGLGHGDGARICGDHESRGRVGVHALELARALIGFDLFGDAGSPPREDLLSLGSELAIGEGKLKGQVVQRTAAHRAGVFKVVGDVAEDGFNAVES